MNDDDDVLGLSDRSDFSYLDMKFIIFTCTTVRKYKFPLSSSTIHLCYIFYLSFTHYARILYIAFNSENVGVVDAHLSIPRLAGRRRRRQFMLSHMVAPSSIVSDAF